MENYRRIMCFSPLFAAIVWLSLPAEAAPKLPEGSVEALYRALAEENYQEARRQADALLRSAAPDDRMVASRAYGRILLGLGRTNEVRQYRAMINRHPQDVDTQQLMKVYDAWLLSLERRSDAAAHALEQVLAQGLHMPASVEAAEVLARLYAERGNHEMAKRAVDRGRAILQHLHAAPPYLQTLLERRLGGDEPKAERLYRQAEAFRNRNDHIEAGRTFLEAYRCYPATEFGHAAGYRVGKCLAALGHHRQAADHWRAFVEVQPAGPWRGQAQVNMTDLALEHLGDPLAAASHAHKAAATIEGELPPEAELSWRQAAFDIHLRHGAMALGQGRYAAAAAAFAKAREAAADLPRDEAAKAAPEALAGLDRLGDAAKRRLDPLPPELRTADRPAALALTVGNAFQWAAQHERAKGVFDTLLTGSMRTASRPARSLAALGRARACRGLGERAESLAAYRQSLEEHARASWHDQTLREMALLLESAPTGAAEAVAAWRRLVNHYPQSDYVPEALFRAGALGTDAGQWPAAIRDWERLARDFPHSPWTGTGLIRLIDARLERQFDLPAALNYAAGAMSWLDRHAPADGAERADADRSDATPPSLTGCPLAMRVGLLAFLVDRRDEAERWLRRAMTVQPDWRLAVDGQHRIAGAEIAALLEAVRNPDAVTPDAVRSPRNGAAWALALADLYYHAGLHSASIAWCDRGLEGHAAQATRTQRSWALLRRGHNHAVLGEDSQTEAALADFLAAGEADPAAPWADEALVLAANLKWTLHRDADGAIALWQALLDHHPNSTEAPRSTYYLGVAYQWTRRNADARRAFEQLLKQHPDSPLCDAARTQLDKLNAK